MEKITYEEKMDYMDNLLIRSKLLHETCASCISERDLSDMVDLIVDTAKNTPTRQ